jgi:hypothetical protein
MAMRLFTDILREVRHGEALDEISASSMMLCRQSMAPASLVKSRSNSS